MEVKGQCAGNGGSLKGASAIMEAILWEGGNLLRKVGKVRKEVK